MKQLVFIISVRWAQAPTNQYFFALAKLLVQRGHKVIILVDNQRIDVEDHEANPAIYTWPSKKPTHWRDARFLFRLVRDNPPDVMISNFNSVNLMLIVGWLMNVPVRIAWYHTMLEANLINTSSGNWKTPFYIWRKRFVYALASHLVANSTASREDLIKAYHIPRDHTSVIYNNMTDPLKTIQGSIKDPNLLVCVGRVTLSKGQDILVKAISLLKDRNPDLRVEIIGKLTQREGYQKFVQEMVQELGVAEFCIFTGALSHDEVLEHMARARCTVFPTRSEAFGLVNMESMAVGTPVIASNVGGIPEVIRDGVDGLLVPVDDPDRLAEAIGRILADDLLHDRLSAAGRQHFLDLFEQSRSIESQADWFVRLACEVRR
jgi:glycosyltransferase involved in cell wall biosynthesis